jgi:hypothetical protein
MLEIKFCSWWLDLLGGESSEKEDSKVDDGPVDGADVSDGVVEQVVCFGSLGMHARLSTSNTGAFSSRAFGTASRLLWLLTSRRNSRRTFS